MNFKWTLALMMPLVVACGGKKTDIEKPSGASAPLVDVIIASPQSIPNLVEANGTVVSNEYVEIRPEISGRLTYLNVSEGKQISKGSVLAKINDADLRAQLNKVRVQLNLANITLDRYTKLLQIQGINKADYDVAQNQVSSYQADINILEAEIAKTIIRAPFSGVIGLKQISMGAIVTPQTLIATLQKMGDTRIDFTIPEGYANLLKRGSLVKVALSDNDSVRLNAQVVAVEPQISTATRNVLIRAKLLNGHAVSPGSFAKVYVDAGAENGIMIPANAIIPDARAKQVVTVKNGNAQFNNVETGVRKEGSVQVLKGLQPGDSVVVSGVLFARPNSQVQIRNVKTLAEVIN